MTPEPARWTRPLSEVFPAAIDPFLPALRLVWRVAFGYDFEQWQVDLLRAITEVYPAGHRKAGRMRYRQVLVSMGRQNGKTEIAAALGLFGLLRKAGALVGGIAYSAEQARIVYQRTMAAIDRNPALKARFDALTDTRGLRAKDGGRYEIKAAKGAALQGLPIDLGVVDEVHLLKTELWTALVNGTGGRDDCLVVGITTAGDEDAELLTLLYEQASAAEAEGASTRFGAFIFESPFDTIPDDDGELAAGLLAANPSLAAGREGVDLENVIADVRAMPAADAVRYRLNRFTASSASFVDVLAWVKCTRPEGVGMPGGRVIFTVDRTPDWGFATVVATVRGLDGTVWTEVVASVVKPTLESLAELCVRLSRHSPGTFALDGYALRDLGTELKRRGLPVTVLTQGDTANASSVFYARVQAQTIRHAGDQLIGVQLPRTIRKNAGEGFRVSRKDSSVAIDAVMATVLGVFVADTFSDAGVQVF